MMAPFILSHSLLLLLLLIFASLSALPLSQSLPFLPSTFGAFPDDGVDDTAGLQATIDAAIKSGPLATVQLMNGTYDLSAALNINGAASLTVTGATTSAASTQLLFHNNTGALYYSGCSNLTLSAFSIDFIPTAWQFTAGMVVQVSASPPYTFDILPTPPHLAQAGQLSAAIFVFDPVNMRPAFGRSTYEVFQSVTTPSVLMGDGTVRFALAGKSQFKVGQSLVVRYSGGPHAISGGDSLGVLMQGMTVYTGGDMSHASNRVHNLTVVDYHVRRGPGRWLSTWADCMHFGDHRGNIRILNSSCEGMGDDGLNVHSYFFNCTAVLNATTAVISLTKSWLDTLNVGVGTQMAFARAASPFVAYQQLQVAALQPHSSISYLYTFTTPLSTVQVGDVVYVADAPSLLLSNFTVSSNRARGVLLETRNVTVERCLFHYTSGPALLFQPSFYWEEAEPGGEVTVTETVFEGCNQGIAQQEGVVTILPDPVQLFGVIDGVTVERSTFLQGEYSGGLLQSYNGKRVTLQDNFVSNFSASATPLYVCNSEQLLVSRNHVWNGSAAGYVMDHAGVCSDALSTGLNFTSEAFNASTQATVMPSPSGYGVVVVNDAEPMSTPVDALRMRSVRQRPRSRRPSSIAHSPSAKRLGEERPVDLGGN